MDQYEKPTMEILDIEFEATLCNSIIDDPFFDDVGFGDPSFPDD